MLIRRQSAALMALLVTVTTLVLSGLMVHSLLPEDAGAAAADTAPAVPFLAAYPAPATPTPTPSPTPTPTPAAYPAPGQRLFFPVLDSNAGGSGSVDWVTATPTPVGTSLPGARH